jgi:hypothetical protein
MVRDALRATHHEGLVTQIANPLRLAARHRIPQMTDNSGASRACETPASFG